MEVKVFVNGLPRVVCGLTKGTTCQEVVVALAQALGQAGRYTLWEKFKDFQRCMAPTERVLETLERYGELVRDVRLTLILNGPAGCDPMGRRFQPHLPLRRKDPSGGRLRRGSSSLSLHRQSLPPLIEQQADHAKRPRRKSLTIMEEAWEWMESLGRGKVYKTTSERDLRKNAERKSCTSSEGTLSFCINSAGRKKREDKIKRTDLNGQTSCCIRGHPKQRERRSSEEKIQELTSLVIEEEKKRLIENILSQKNSLEDLEMQIAIVDRQIFELEERARSQKAEEEAKQREVEEESEQIMFWKNELKAEEDHERDLKKQFLEIKDRVTESKAKREELKYKTQGLEIGPETQESRAQRANGAESSRVLNATAELRGCTASNRKSRPRDNCSPPQALVAPCQIKERRPTGPAELREWWAHWAQAQKTQNKVIHRSELTIYLKSTKV